MPECAVVFRSLVWLVLLIDTINEKNVRASHLKRCGWKDGVDMYHMMVAYFQQTQ